MDSFKVLLSALTLTLLALTVDSSSGGNGNYNYDLSGPPLTDLYNSRVQRAELVNRPLEIKVGPFHLGPFELGPYQLGKIQWGPFSHSGVRVTLDDGAQWLVHKGSGFGLSSQTVVTDARHMSSDWKTVSEREFHGSKTVSDFVGAGGPDYRLLCDNCHKGADRMMEQQK